MYALTYINKGSYNSTPFASTSAVSEDKEKLRKELRKCVTEDCQIDEDATNDNKNWSVLMQYDDVAELENSCLEEYCKYSINKVEVL